MAPPRARTLDALLCEQAAGGGADRIALRSPAGERTYGELAARAAAVAAGLGRLGIAPGQTVGLLAPNVPEWLDAAFGGFAAGARVAAFNTWSKAWDLEYLLAHSGARALVMASVVGRNDLLGELRTLVPEAWDGAPGSWRSERFPALRHLVLLDGEVPAGGVSWAELVDAGDRDPAGVGSDPDLAGRGSAPGPAGPACGPGDPAFVLYTSGSTDYPKAVPLLHAGIIENGFNIGERMGLTAEDRVFLASPLFWSFGAANALAATFGHGATLALMGAFEPAAAVDLIVEQRCTAAYLLPAIADALLAEGGPRIRAAGSLRTGLMIGRPDEIERVIDELGVGELCNIYGSTETYGNCCVTPHDLPRELRVTTQGPPLPGVSLRIVDPDTRAEQPPQTDGEIEVRGYITPGYLGDETATSRAITPDGWYRTGDLGQLGADGYLRFGGRATEMIKSSGINISPAEIERFVTTHGDVAEVVVVGAPHPTRDEVAVAFVHLTEGATLSAEALLDFCRESIAGYKVPATVVMCDQLPTTNTGKVALRVLRERAAEAVQELLSRTAS